MFQETFSKIGEAFIETLPSFIEIILVFIIGWYISKWIGQGVARFLEKTKINQIIKRVGWQESLAKMDISFNIPRTLGEFFRWCIFLLFLMAIAEIAQLPGVSQFLVQVISFLPNIFIALLIFLLALLAVDFSQKIVIGSLEKEKITYSKILGQGIRSSIWMLAALAILYQLKIVPALILSGFVAFLATLTLVIGLAFGLGGKDMAKKILEDIKNKFS